MQIYQQGSAPAILFVLTNSQQLTQLQLNHALDVRLLATAQELAL